MIISSLELLCSCLYGQVLVLLSVMGLCELGIDDGQSQIQQEEGADEDKG